MDESSAPTELRLWALETVLSFVIASQHMQTNDPLAALRRYQGLLLDQAWPLSALPEGHRAAAAAELGRLADRIASIQAELPRRLVD